MVAGGVWCVHTYLVPDDGIWICLNTAGEGAGLAPHPQTPNNLETVQAVLQVISCLEESVSKSVVRLT